ncbi:peptide chain release factor N(5)-glutamine methyltransferase [Luteimonas kalidii]|uniref:Release factor glutamine methyltransferase n=1 Tax=Luteimonas kalidii TaxID=3042025 RepID=A0ABT6JT74_9GAMM|nr:peptide chain release factor N(5)-glutamine methyltransferase [Luteimonas kalidii]MDH5833151.1 peptide chain release factor N(5)-glutamine methyltransferase [Luteimonas kalidii]
MPTSEPITARRLLADARARIDLADAQALLAHALGRDRSWLFAHADDPLQECDRDRFLSLVARREAGEPVAYLCGRRGFWTLDLAVTPDTLIPRPETELLVELALARLPAVRALRVADLGTGSGAIALALAQERPQARVDAVDASPGALEVARRNASEAGLENVAFHLGDWFAALPDLRFDLVASNPPYIAEGDPHLARGDLRHEPAMALSSGRDGLDAIRAIVRDAPAHLQPGGWLLLEHGHDQGEPVGALLREAGLVDVATHRDLEGRDRVGLGRLPA